MIDPVPDGYVGLDEAVAVLAADTSDREVHEHLEPTAEELNPASLTWIKREMAIPKLYAALRDGSLIGLVRNPVSGEWFRLTGIDWHGAALWREMILGSIVRAAPTEEIARHEGRRILLRATALDAWRKKLAQSRPQAQPAEAACAAWLEAAMRASPERRPKAKREFRDEAKSKFGISARAFDRLWSNKLEITGARWSEAGAPSKLPQ
jgi:hypothetical protein